MIVRQVPERIFLCLVIFLIIAFSVAPSAQQQLGAFPLVGWFAYLSRGTLGVLTLVALLDTLVNDLLPPKYSVSIKLQHRQLIWMFLGCTLVGLAYVSFRVNRDVWGGIWLSVFGARCASIAFLDLKYEIDERKKDKTCANFSTRRS